MAAKIGILGESTVVTGATTTTVYTVPADKAARIRIMFGLEGPAGGLNSTVISIGTPGAEWTMGLAPGTNANDLLSGPAPVGAGANAPSDTIGIGQGVGVLDLTTDIGDRMWILTPYPHEYCLSTGDTVKVRQQQSDDWTDVLFQVQGVEDDA
jgi:hypothetical protein